MPAELPRIILKDRKAGPFVGRHPWVFSGAIAQTLGNPADGAEIALFTSDDRFVAYGLFNSQSQIRARLYSWHENSRLTDAFFAERVRAAVAFRRSLGLAGPDSACRLVFSESDGLSGLVADYYAGFAALQFNSLAMAQRKQALADALAEAMPIKGIYLRTEKGIRDLEGLEMSDGLFRGAQPDRALVIVENGLKFEVDVAEGQKTGFYADQRDNRRAAAHFAKGRRCLDVCCYTGGFALNLAGAGASAVAAIDSSAAALETARRNAALNNLANVEFAQGDAFSLLADMAGRGDRFDLAVLDPPRFVQSSGGLGQALGAYARLNAATLRLLNPGGILVSCSCSGRVSPDEFTGMLSTAALSAGRTVRVIQKHGQPADHPVSVACPESDYLKCFICHVE